MQPFWRNAFASAASARATSRTGATGQTRTNRRATQPAPTPQDPSAGPSTVHPVPSTAVTRGSIFAYTTIMPRLTCTVPEAASLLGISPGLAYELARRGELPTIRFGRRIVVPRAALERLVEGELDGPHSKTGNQL